MPLPYAHIVNPPQQPSFVATQHLLHEDEDDLDDICPVCESECTCPKKSAPTPASTATEPSASSTPSSAPSTASQQRPTHAGKNPLKIKLSLSKARKPPHPSSAHIPSAQDAGPSSSRPSTADASGPAPPKRRGRPPKALATKLSAKQKMAADDMEYKARGTIGTARKLYQSSVTVPSTSAGDLSDSTLSDYPADLPTFLPAASESTLSSSSASSDSEIESSDTEDEGDHMFHLLNDLGDDNRHATRLLPSHVGQQPPRRRDRGSGNKWEVRPRKKSVGVGEDEDEDVESSADTDDSSADESEDGDDENEEDEDAEADADVEGGGGLCEPDADFDDEEEDERRSCIGITFPENGWSEDEEESFDADLFFANLDGSSDSGSSSPGEHYADLRDVSGSFSGDEEDALLLMDIDPSVQLRRAGGEFEIGVELDTLSFGWDGQLLLTNRLSDGLGLSFGIGGPDDDADMFSASGSDATDSEYDDDGSGTGTVVLQESDGDTTEVELVDSDGLPNSRAMMLFRWPSTVSAINPSSTVSPFANPPVDASPSTRIALASISTQRRSPPHTPAGILSGKLSMDDLEDFEMEKEKSSSPPMGRRRGAPLMGEFNVENANLPKQAAIVAVGREVPSFYPRPARAPRAIESAQHQQQEATVEDVFMSTLRPPMQMPTESSDEAQQGGLSQPSQSYTSDLDLSSTEAIELDDVLDSSLLDSEPSTQECETDTLDAHSQSSPIKGPGSHIHSLSRWDRVPMGTFRRTRETATASGVDGAASDTGLGNVLQYRGVGALMGGMAGMAPLFTPPLDKMSRASARKRKARATHSHGTSPTLSARDSSSVLGSPFAPSASGSGIGSGAMAQHPQAYAPLGGGKSKKELKKEKAMMKRKLGAKSAQYRQHQGPHRAAHHHHVHHPNHKSRASNAVQRSGFLQGAGSAVPSLAI